MTSPKLRLFRRISHIVSNIQLHSITSWLAEMALDDMHIEDDCHRMVDELEKTIGQAGWEVLAHVWKQNVTNEPAIFFKDQSVSR